MLVFCPRHRVFSSKGQIKQVELKHQEEQVDVNELFIVYAHLQAFGA